MRGVGCFGFASIVKFAETCVTISCTLMFRVISGSVEVPVIVKLYVPGGVPNDVSTVKVELTAAPCWGVTGFGEILPVDPGGRPYTCKLTGELKLPTEVTLNEYDAALPCAAVCEFGAPDSKKSNRGPCTNLFPKSWYTA